MRPDSVFVYPVERHLRRHGPLGYIDYQSFKPWLRDEFRFSCCYCLWRETWCADGDGSFGIDHVRPRVKHPERSGEYNNLVYACCRCNTVKQDQELPVDPCKEGWGKHLLSDPDGTVCGLTSQGQRTIEICRLNRPRMVEACRRMLRLLAELAVRGTGVARSLLREYLGFPANLPVLSQLHPPGGNIRPEGIAESYFEQRKQGKLPETY